MLVVAAIWIYVMITTYLMGYAFLQFVSSLEFMQTERIKRGKGSKKKYNARYQSSYIVAGLVIGTIYAEIFSLGGGVGLAANIIMVAVCTAIFVYFHDDLLNELVDVYRIIFGSKNFIYYVLVFLIMAYGTSHGIMHYDSDLYHAQAIHWIEEFGIVKGLGNLHVRLAYNSASFALSALYSLAFIKGQSFHVMAGFFALILSWECLDLKDIIRRRHFVLSDFARVMAIYYLFTIYDEMVAPASDYYLSIMVFYIIIRWLDLNVRHERSLLPYILLALSGVYAVTIKLSAAPILLLSIIPIYKLVKKKNYKALGMSVFMGFIIAIPFFIRNVIISGWLVYPVTLLDFFNFEWKIPSGVAQYDAKEIRTFGRGYTDVAQYGDVPMLQWIPNWFSSIGGINKIMLILDIVSVIIYAACLVYFIAAAIGSATNGKNKEGGSKILKLSHRSMVNLADFVTIGGTMVGCLIFWLFSAPLIRYGEVYVFMTFAIVLGRIFILFYNRVDWNKDVAIWLFRFVTMIICLWILYKGFNLVKEDIPRFNAKYLVTQQDYGTYETAEFKVENELFYFPVDGDRIGYYPFPSAPRDMSGEIKFLGNNIQSGFKSILK